MSCARVAAIAESGYIQKSKFIEIVILTLLHPVRALAVSILCRSHCVIVFVQLDHSSLDFIVSGNLDLRCLI